MHFPKLVLATAILSLACPRSPAQGPQPAVSSTTTQRAESRLVLADTVVTDKKGNNLHDLAPTEFHVWEDKQEQTITNVSRESVGTRPDTRWVLLFGRMQLGDQAQVRDAAVRLIDVNASSMHPMAVLNYQTGGGVQVVQTFTTDKKMLEDAVKYTKGADLTSGMSGQVNTVMVPGPSDIRNHPVSPWNIQAPAGTPNSYSSYVRELLLTLGDVAKSLASVPGRKILVVLTPGISYVDEPQDMAAVINACNRANVVVYAIDLRRLGSVAVNALSPLATGTGGLALERSNDTFGDLMKIARDQEERYVIAYRPSKSADRSCHTLQVKVDRAESKVRARDEYCNIDPGDPLAGTQFDEELRGRAAGSQPGNVAASMQVPFFYRSPDTAIVQVVADVPTQVLKFEKREDKFHAAMNVLGIAYKPDGIVGARFSQVVDFDLAGRKEVDDFQRNPYHYEGQFKVAPGSYNLKVVFGFDHENFAKLEAPLTIEPYDGKHFSLSEIAICKNTRQFAGTENVDTLLADHRLPLVSRGLRFLPAGNTHFRKTDAVTLYTEIYDPLLLDASPPKVEIQLLVLEQKSQAIRVNSGVLDVTNRIVSGNSVVPVGLKVPFDQLTPGSYQLAVKAADSAGNVSVVRMAEFELE